MDELLNLFELFNLKWDREYSILRKKGGSADEGSSRVPGRVTMIMSAAVIMIQENRC